MHLWLPFQLLVIKGGIIMTASDVLWWWEPIFLLIMQSQSLILCQPSSSLHCAALSCPRGRELAWKIEKKTIKKKKKARGGTEIWECESDGPGDSILLQRHPRGCNCFKGIVYPFLFVSCLTPPLSTANYLSSIAGSAWVLLSLPNQRCTHLCPYLTCYCIHSLSACHGVRSEKKWVNYPFKTRTQDIIGYIHRGQKGQRLHIKHTRRLCRFDISFNMQ